MRNSWQTTGYPIHASEGREREFVIASEFEYRHRFAIIAFIFVCAYAFYNLDPLNIVYAIVPRNLGALNQDVLARFVYAVSALLAGIGAAILTWASASRLSSPDSDRLTVRCLKASASRKQRNSPARTNHQQSSRLPIRRLSALLPRPSLVFRAPHDSSELLLQVANWVWVENR